MTDEQIIKTNDLLIVVATMALLSGLSLMCLRSEEEAVEIVPPETEVEVKKEKEIVTHREPVPALVEEMELRNTWQSIDIYYTTIEYDYLGRYFITAYSDEETNSRATASGVEVHYSDDPYEPTTCAIDRNYHRFGELFMTDGHVYVAEDTGAFRGLWIDCFVETMEEVWSWPTGYKSVYTVEYKENYLSGKERQEINERFRSYLHYRSDGSRAPYRNDY